ncbi:MAG: hypothetical protein AAB677_02050 [Patescibacteria group bacterium]
MNDLNDIAVPLADQDHHWSKNKTVVALVIVVVLIVAGLIYIGRRYGAPIEPPATPVGELTEAQKAEILKSLKSNPVTPLTDAQKAEIIKSLTSSTPPPPLTDAQKAEILKSLKQSK